MNRLWKNCSCFWIISDSVCQVSGILKQLLNQRVCVARQMNQFFFSAPKFLSFVNLFEKLMEVPEWTWIAWVFYCQHPLKFLKTFLISSLFIMVLFFKCWKHRDGVKKFPFFKTIFKVLVYELLLWHLYFTSV